MTKQTMKPENLHKLCKVFKINRKKKLSLLQDKN